MYYLIESKKDIMYRFEIIDIFKNNYTNMYLQFQFSGKMASLGMSKWGHWFWRTKVGPLPLVFLLGKKFQTIHIQDICTNESCFYRI